MGTDKVLCLISGPSGSGKTSIASELKNRLSIGFKKKAIEVDGTDNQSSKPGTTGIQNPVSAVVIHQDHYFTKPFIPYKERVDNSYENGSGIDWESLMADVQSALEESKYGNNGIASGDKIPTIVIVEGHLLGDAAALFRERFFCENIGMLGIFLVGCSRESCKRRRLNRRKDRSEEERQELADYIDAFVWPSFVSSGVEAMDALRQALVGAKSTKTNPKYAYLSVANENCSRDTNSTIAVALDIDNSKNANFGNNVDDILNRIRHMLSK